LDWLNRAGIEITTKKDFLDAPLFLEYTQQYRLGVTHPGDCISRLYATYQGETMQLTVEFEDASRIAALAQIAEIMKLSFDKDGDAIQCIYPLDVVSAMNIVLDALDNVLTYIDSPYQVSQSVGSEASTMAHRMLTIGQRILDMQNENEK